MLNRWHLVLSQNSTETVKMLKKRNNASTSILERFQIAFNSQLTKVFFRTVIVISLLVILSVQLKLDGAMHRSTVFSRETHVSAHKEKKQL